MPNKANYYIAILPDGQVSNKIRELQELMATRFESKHALRNPPHITIVPPFSMDVTNEQQLKKLLMKSIKTVSLIELEIHGFGCFGKHTIYANVLENLDLTELRNSLIDVINAESGLVEKKITYFQKFVPHITIGYRDLKDHFKEAWDYFEKRSLKERLVVQKLNILKHNGEEWISIFQI